MNEYKWHWGDLDTVLHNNEPIKVSELTVETLNNSSAMLSVRIPDGITKQYTGKCYVSYDLEKDIKEYSFMVEE